MRGSWRCSRGFSLVELGVVLAVTSLLALLIVPALAQARRTSLGVGCLGNLRNWGQGTHGFALENLDFLPVDGAANGTSRDRAWYVDLPPYLGERPYPEQGRWRTNPAGPLPRSVWLCPANTRRSDGRMLFHYSLNRLVNGSGGDARQIRLGELPEPARTVWLFDNGREAAVAIVGNVHTNLHRAGANILFLDGHASRVARSSYWDPVRNRATMDRPELRWIGRDP